LNLTNNAIKFTEHGSVCVELEHRLLDGRSLIEIRVVDTGNGIHRDEHSKLFQAFSQIDASSTSRRFEGTGLGLYLSQKLARLLGGEIKVISELGSGSTFTLLLPGD